MKELALCKLELLANGSKSVPRTCPFCGISNVCKKGYNWAITQEAEPSCDEIGKVAVSSHFNKLSPAEHERLSMLAEEAGEIVLAVGKILRHGYASYHPKNPATDNRADLSQEVGDILGIIDEMMLRRDLQPKVVEASRRTKWARASRYIHHHEDDHTT